MFRDAAYCPDCPLKTGRVPTYRTEYGCLLTNGQVFRHQDLDAAQQHVERALKYGHGDIPIVSRQVPVIAPGPWEPVTAPARTAT
jgi:ribosomal protein L16/L10AE